ncbi:MAG: N-acetyl-alpha-D-glucosaminyl L-malate synthase BshA [Myxococcaceae bacterium]|nr:N-acetyl-alpha-D-glucosaminyl L-malate synthase BshA [Myxococcaceae bacterium]
MRVGIVCHASFGGSGVIATELALALAEHGHQVHLVAAHEPPRLPATRPAGLTFHAVGSPVHPLFPHGEFTLALASALAELGPRLDVLHVHYAIPLATSAVLACELAGPGAPRLVTTVHGTDVLTIGQERAFRPLVKQALERSALVTAPSAWLAQQAVAGFALARAVQVVPNFVDSGRFCPPEARPAGLPRLTHNSNFRALKRVEDVVQVFDRVRRVVPCELELLGDGPERPRVEALVRALGLRAQVHFAGETSDVAPHLKASDVFLLPSEVESFGLAALEAMSCGVPVVASAVGGVSEVVRDGVTGFLHPVGDVDAMAASTVRLLQDRALHRTMSREARSWCTAHWQRAPVVARWEALYRTLLETP